MPTTIGASRAGFGVPPKRTLSYQLSSTFALPVSNKPTKMRNCLLAFLPVILFCVGCACPQGDRYAALYELSATPMSEAKWNNLIGNYSGPIRSHVHTWMGTTGIKSEEVALSLRGTAMHPKIYLKIRGSYSTAWTGLGSQDDVYTNIARLEYGAKVPLEVTTHAPNVLVVEIPKRIYIMRFACPGTIEVDELGINGWRGTGRLLRIPDFPCPVSGLSRAMDE